jgi:hypothetical protein
LGGGGTQSTWVLLPYARAASAGCPDHIKAVHTQQCLPVPPTRHPIRSFCGSTMSSRSQLPRFCVRAATEPAFYDATGPRSRGASAAAGERNAPDETDRQTDRQTSDRQHRIKHRIASRQTSIRSTDRQTDRQTDKTVHRDRQTETDRQTDTASATDGDQHRDHVAHR